MKRNWCQVGNEKDVKVRSKNIINVWNEKEIKVQNQNKIKVWNENKINFQNKNEIKVQNENDINIWNGKDVKVRDRNDVKIEMKTILNCKMKKCICRKIHEHCLSWSVIQTWAVDLIWFDGQTEIQLLLSCWPFIFVIHSFFSQNG